MLVFTISLEADILSGGKQMKTAIETLTVDEYDEKNRQNPMN